MSKASDGAGGMRAGKRLARAEAAAGAGAWLALAWLEPFSAGTLGRIHRLLLLAILVLVPLVLSLAAGADRAGLAARALRAALPLHPLAAAAAAASFFLAPGPLAAALAAPWGALTALVALSGLGRLLRRGLIASEEVAIDLGFLYLPVGALWLVASRAGVAPLGFGEPIAILTAAHFHVAGFAAPVLAGLAGRALLALHPGLRGRFAPVATGIVLGLPLVAAGITASPLVEILGVAVFVTSLVALAALLLLRVAPAAQGLAARALLRLSALSLAAGMALAAVYGVSEFARADWISVPAMADTHAWANALGFALLGALAFALEGAPPASRAEAPPFSRLASRGRVGPDFFARAGAVAPGAAGRAPRGLVDLLADYRRPDFEPDEVHPDVRAFYEETGAFGLIVHPDWAPAFRLAGRIYKRLAARVGQMNFPVAGALHEDLIESAILPIDDAADGRRDVRAWVRTYARTGEAVYVAAYSNHSLGRETYMNIAFPLPAGNLTSILRIETAGGAPPGARGVVLTTLPGPGGARDAGIYFANRLLPVRLPMNETIRVWPAGAPGAPAPAAGTGTGGAISVVARHDMWLCGLRFLTLHYEIFRKRSR